MDQPDTQRENVTVVNTPQPANNSGNNDGYGFLLKVVVLVIVVVLFFWYVFPYIRGLSNMGHVQVNVPDKIDVNVQSK